MKIVPYVKMMLLCCENSFIVIYLYHHNVYILDYQSASP